VSDHSSIPQDADAENGMNANDEFENNTDLKGDQAPANAGPAEEGEQQAPPDELSTMKAEVERLEAEASEYLDGWQRARAEFINFKRRTKEENENTRARITGDILVQFLEIIDDLDLALESKPDGDDLQAWIGGIELIRQKLMLILQGQNIEEIPVDRGNCFDPALHEAVTFEEDDELEEGEIIGTIKKGYILKERVLRPAQVRVAK